jgi:hypothetical protein
MPTEAENLTKDSPDDKIKSAISSCISQMMDEGGRSQEQVIAICHSMARKSTGRELKKKSTSIS